MVARRCAVHGMPRGLVGAKRSCDGGAARWERSGDGSAWHGAAGGAARPRGAATAAARHCDGSQRLGAATAVDFYFVFYSICRMGDTMTHF